MAEAVITIGIDPTIELGPITLAWHGLMIAVGIVVGALTAAHEARRRGLDPERLYPIAMIVVIAALVGGRAFYLLEHGRLADPGSGSPPPASPSTAASSLPLEASPTTSDASDSASPISTRSPPVCRSGSPSGGSAT